MQKLLFIVMLTVFLTPYGHSQWNSDGDTVPDTHFRKSVGDFGAFLLITDKADELFTNWNKPGAVVPVSTTTQVKRNQLITVVITFTGCQADSKGNCNTTVDYLILKPDKSVYGDIKDVELWVNKPAPEKGQVQLSLGNINIGIEPNDPFGIYEVIAKVKDNNGKISFTLNQNFEVIK